MGTQGVWNCGMSPSLFHCALGTPSTGATLAVGHSGMRTVRWSCQALPGPAVPIAVCCCHPGRSVPGSGGAEALCWGVRRDVVWQMLFPPFSVVQGVTQFGSAWFCAPHTTLLGSLQPWQAVGVGWWAVGSARSLQPAPSLWALPDDSQMVIALLLFPVTFVTLGRQRQRLG